MSDEIYVAGVSMTPFGRMPERTVRDLARQAAFGALSDAGIQSADVNAVYFGNCMQGYMDGQHCIRGEVALLGEGFEGIPIVNVENACATGATAFAEAVKFVRSGEGDVALALGAERLTCEDRTKMLSAFDGAWDVANVEKNLDCLRELGEGVAPPAGFVSANSYSPFMDVYAALARFNMRTLGHTQRQYAAIASKNHAHAVENPTAHIRRRFSIDEVLAAPPITFPLTRPMCAPVSDGAAAVIVCSAYGLRALGISRGRAVRVLASVMRTGSGRAPSEYPERHIASLTSKAAYERAGLGSKDVDVAEVHDATAVGEAIQMECLGFADAGDGGALAERGVTALGGALPVNPSGGLESKGHPIAATGLAQIYEIVSQLRGECGSRQVEGARIGLAENGGGFWRYEEAACCVAILAKT